MRLQIGEDRRFGALQRKDKKVFDEDNFVTFIQQIKEANLHQRLYFEIQWIFRTQLFEHDVNWKPDNQIYISYDELREENENSFFAKRKIEGHGRESEKKMREDFEKHWGTTRAPFVYRGPMGRAVADDSTNNKCDRTFARIRMFIRNKGNEAQLLSNFSDLLSFDAPSQGPMALPNIETLMYNAQDKYLKVIR